jgi:hypothetical protein
MARPTYEDERAGVREALAKYGPDVVRDVRKQIVNDLRALAVRAPVDVTALRAELERLPAVAVDADAWHLAVGYRRHSHREGPPSIAQDPYYSRGLLDWYRPAQYWHHAPVVIEGHYDRIYERECTETGSRTARQYWQDVHDEPHHTSREFIKHAYRYLTRGRQ